MEQKLIKSMTGYKATDANMQCKGYQFKLGEWHELPKDKPLALCQWGFHFCKYPSGVWAYHNESGTRVFKIEAEEILEAPEEPGADYKLVCYRIKLIEEIIPTGNGNTGDRNTGNGNTGDRNTGDRNTGNGNTGDRNTGNRNTGNGNTGDRNTGNGNTGDRNTGNWNTGYWNKVYRNSGDRNTGNGNTGDRNTGNRNTGNGNTGDRNTGNGNTGDRNTGNGNTGYGNTGDRNTGNGNTGDFHSGFFCQEIEKVKCFDMQTKYTREQFQSKFGNLYSELLDCLVKDEDISFSKFKKLPGITKKKLASLHKKHIEGLKTN